MKKGRLFAWMLIVAMLAMSCTALGEELNVEMADDATSLSEGLEVEMIEDVPDLLDSDALSVELPELELSDEAEGLEANDSQLDRAPVHYVADGADNDDMFGGYVDLLFGRRPVGDVRSNGFIGDTLCGKAKEVYDYLEKEIKQVAAGARSSTVFWIPTCIADSSDFDYLNKNIVTIHTALLTDLAYHLYWYDKTFGIYLGAEEGRIYYCYPVAKAYASEHDNPPIDYEFDKPCHLATNTSLIRAAHVAVSNAKKVVRKHAGASDYRKLCCYRDYICDAVDYNDDAVKPELTDNYDENAWQLIWVFDEDPTTKVVCEGYAKAFQYLCDLSSFSTGVQSHVVAGTAYQADGSSGGHMWNIVTMGNGKNYHVDVTWVDGGATDYFLCGAEKTEKRNTYLVRNQDAYEMDDYIMAQYPAKTLKLSTRDYNPDETVAAKSVKLKKGSTTLKKGEKLSVKRGKSMTLRAVVSGAKPNAKLTWESSNSDVTVKDGKVTVSKKAKAGDKAKITVTTSSGMSTYIYVVVK